MTASHPIRIGLLEDDLTFRDYLVAALSADPELTMVLNESTLAAALQQLSVNVPDVLLVDMQLPDGSGLDLVREAVRTLPACKIIMLTVLFDRNTVVQAIESGAHGYLLKDTPPAQIRSAIRDVLADQAPISPAAAAHLLANIRRTPPDPASAPTAREQEVLECIAKGLSYAEVAKVLAISVHTVGDHIKAIYRKLAVNSKSEAIFEGRQQGWLSLSN